MREWAFDLLQIPSYSAVGAPPYWGGAGWHAKIAGPSTLIQPMNIDPDAFSDEQRKFLTMLVDDFGGPCCTGSLLRILEEVIYQLKPDFDLDSQAVSADTRSDLEVCFAALQFLKVQQVAEAK